MPIRTRLDLPSKHEYIRGKGCEYCAKTGFRGRIGLRKMETRWGSHTVRIMAGTAGGLLQDLVKA